MNFFTPSSKTGKKDVGDLVVSQGGRGPVLLIVVVYLNLYSEYIFPLLTLSFLNMTT